MPTRHRLHVAAPLRPGAELVLPGERSHYVSRVLRLRAGDPLILFDGNGGEYAATISRVLKEGVTLVVGEACEREVESPLDIQLIQGISRGDRMDWVVQKTTELGVRRITPVITEFSVVRLDQAKAEKRASHWTKVAQSACEQCGRTVVPTVDQPERLARVVEQLAAAESSRIVLHPGAQRSLRELAGGGGPVVLLIGPEGGLSHAEVEAAVAAGFARYSLGPRILRTETAAVAAISVLQSQLGDLR